MAEAPSFIGEETLRNFNGIDAQDDDDIGTWEHDDRTTSFIDDLTQETPYDASKLAAEYQAKRHSVKGVRSDKDYNLIRNTIDNFQTPIPNLSKARDASKYKQAFLNLIINGNYRIKYIPDAARRDTAHKYCKRHIDADGIPLYRLLPTNATDPLGSSITDLNGDRVDDIVLVDKRGNPAIINGYQLVQASPYKKAWAAKHTTKEARILNPFNTWLAEMFQKSLNNVDWEAGEYKMEANEEMGNMIDIYSKIGLPKPRVSKRLTPNSYWASVFSHIWHFFWNKLYVNVSQLRKLTDYLSSTNVMFAVLYDQPALLATENNMGRKINYPDWILYKKVNSGKYNRAVGTKLQKDTYDVIRKHIDFATNDLQIEQASWDKRFTQIIDTLAFIVFIQGMRVDPSKAENQGLLQKLYNTAVYGDKNRLKANRDKYKNNLTLFMDTDVYKQRGYGDYKISKAQSIDAVRKKAVKEHFIDGIEVESDSEAEA